MQARLSFYRVSTWVLLVFVFGLAVFRAETQSIAHDEGLTYEWFLQGSVYRVLSFNSTNHILFSLIAKVCVKVLGLTELTLRIPSLVGTIAYLAAGYLLCLHVFGDNPRLLVAAGMLSLNPQTMDFMSAARGYILGTAFLLGALYAAVRAVDRGPFRSDDHHWRRACILVSLLLALSVAANLTNLFPAASLIFCLSLLALPGLYRLRPPARDTVRSFARNLLLPGLILGFSLLWPYLIQARPAHFRMGNPRASDALRDFFNASFLYKWTSDVYSPSLGAVPPRPGSWQAIVSDLGVYLLLPALFCFLAAGLLWVLRYSAETRREERDRCLLISGTAVACLALTIVLHVVANVNYPVSRTSLYFVLLFTISALLLGQEMLHHWHGTLAKAIRLLVVFVVLLDYTASVNTRYFRYNAYDSISRDMFRAVEGHARSRGLTGVRIGGSWWYEPEINFYRERYKAVWLLPYDVKDRSYWWETPNSLKPVDYDYFVFTPASDPGLAGPHIREVFRDRGTDIKVIWIER
jgi:hypothetical protein